MRRDLYDRLRQHGVAMELLNMDLAARMMQVPRFVDFYLADAIAAEKSKQLLISKLTPAQREEFQATNGFAVALRDGRRMRIEKKNTFNVTDLGTGVKYCTQSATAVPIYDLMLAQKLMLEADPDSFFAVANNDMEVTLQIEPRERTLVPIDWPLYVLPDNLR